MRHQISTEISIQASPDAVWAVLLDFSKYHEWNPFIVKAEGSGDIGTGLVLTMHPPGGRPMVFKPLIIKRKQAKTLAWLGHLWIRGLFDGEHHFELVANADGSTRLLHAERFRGVLVGPLKKQLDGPTRNGFIAMNEALKKRCEGAAGALTSQ